MGVSLASKPSGSVGFLIWNSYFVKDGEELVTDLLEVNVLLWFLKVNNRYEQIYIGESAAKADITSWETLQVVYPTSALYEQSHTRPQVLI